MSPLIVGAGNGVGQVSANPTPSRFTLTNGPVPPGENPISTADATGAGDPSRARVSVESTGTHAAPYWTRTGSRYRSRVVVPSGF